MSGKTLADYKAPYPAPTEDQKRYVIYLDPKADEDSNFKLQLIPGRIEMVDGANHHFIGGTIEEKTVSGWGYGYYVVSLGPMAGTLMSPFGEAAEKRPRFVQMNNNKLIRYNSKLPVVVYVPKDAELRYKIWSAAGGDSVLAKEE